MAKVYLVCGKIASGKTTYSHRLMERERAVLLSCDEITLALFDGYIGERHDDIVARTQKYLMEKSLEILKAGVNVILDWGFWMKEEREEIRAYYVSHGAAFEFHFVDPPQDVWQRGIAKRNAEVKAGRTSAYYVDDALAAKFEGLFEMPEESEIDVWIINDW